MFYVKVLENKYPETYKFEGLAYNICNRWELFAWTGPLACLSPFSVKLWIRSDKCLDLRSVIPMSLVPRIKVPNKSLSHELNNVFIWDQCSLLLRHGILKKLLTYIDRVWMHEPQNTRFVMYCALCIAAAAMHDLRLPQLARVGRI